MGGNSNAHYRELHLRNRAADGREKRGQGTDVQLRWWVLKNWNLLRGGGAETDCRVRENLPAASPWSQAGSAQEGRKTVRAQPINSRRRCGEVRKRQGQNSGGKSIATGERMCISIDTLKRNKQEPKKKRSPYELTKVGRRWRLRESGQERGVPVGKRRDQCTPKNERGVWRKNGNGQQIRGEKSD